MMLTIVTILNVGYLGERHQVLPIQEQIAQTFNQFQVKTFQHEDSDPNIVKKLETELSKENKNILLLSGKNGCIFIQRKDIQNLIESKNFFVIWVGHQHPDGLIENEKWFNRIALPLYIIDSYPILKKTFGDRLIALDTIPNNTKASDLESSLADWNKNHPTEPITISKEDQRLPVGIFLGGDALKRDDVHLYWNVEEAESMGRIFGILALKEKKFLWITNGARTGKFYPNSPNPKDPIIRQFKGSHWIPLSELLKEIPENVLLAGQKVNQYKETSVHSLKSPLDPVSAAFIEGLENSGLKPNSDFRFFDFKTGKSAFNAILAILKNNEKAEAYYSAESIAYASIGYLIANTYAFRVASMNMEHIKGLAHFQSLGLVAEFDPNSFQKQAINPVLKKALMIRGSIDAVRIANSLINESHKTLF